MSVAAPLAAANDHDALAPSPVAGAVAAPARSLLRFFTCGSVDDGKSTLIGRMLYDTGAVFDDQLEALDRDSRKFGTHGDNLDFALLLDGLSAEREQGITIDVAYRYFSSGGRAFIVADTPGHEQYTRNMATGASTADLAVVLVDARKGVLPQTRRHSYIVSMLGVRSIVLAVNKMDLVDFSEEAFEAIVADYRAATASLHFDEIVAIPLAARDGDNVTTPSPRTPWRRGPTLLQHLEAVDPTRAAPRDDAPFAMPVQWVNRPDLDFRGYAGTITAGAVSPGDAVVALPGGRRSTVARVIGPNGDVARAGSSEAATLTLADELDISRGDVIAAASHRLAPRRRISARLLWMSEKPLGLAGDYAIQLSSATANARVAMLHERVDIETFAALHADTLATNQIGLVTLALDRPLVVAPYREAHEFGGFILIDKVTNETAALGVIDESAPIETQVAPLAAVAPLSQPFAAWLREEIGAPKSAVRARFLRDNASFAAAAILLGLVVLALTGSGAGALLVFALELVVHPLARASTRRATQARAGLNSADNDSGGGI